VFEEDKSMNTVVVVTDFERWMVDRLVSSDGCMTSLFHLHNDYALWALSNNAAFVRRNAFEAQLRTEGAVIEGHMVHGLCLKGDLPKQDPIPVDMEEAPIQKGSITAAQLLEDLLQAGPRSTKDIRAAAAQAGFAWSTMQCVKPKLNVRSPIAGIWEMPL
jgi:hypothetical protein